MTLKIKAIQSAVKSQEGVPQAAHAAAVFPPPGKKPPASAEVDVEESAKSFPSPEKQIELAFKLVAKGWLLFPVKKLGKQPEEAGWQQKASCAKEAIQAWAGKYKDCNWAVACGPESNVFVLDVDNKHGHKGDETLAALEAKYGMLPPTLVSHTGSGKGRQFFFQYPDGADYLKNISDGAIGDGLDVKVEGGYCVIPPSVTDIPYTFENKDTPLAPVPEWLLEILEKAANKPSAPFISQETPETHPLIPNKERHKYLASLAGSMLKLKQHISFNELLAVLLAANKAHFVEPKTDAEIEKKAKRFYKDWADKGKVELQQEWEPEVICLADVEEKEVEWLWYPYLPLGMLSLMSGDPGEGKSRITIDMGAAVTTGRTPYNEKLPTKSDAPSVAAISHFLTGKPANVLYFSKENIPEYSVRRRFTLSEGDGNRFYIVAGLKNSTSEETKAITLADVSQIDKLIIKYKPKLVIIDPLQAYIGAKVDMYRSNETRPILEGLADLAAKHMCSILVVRHFIKAKAGRAIHSGAGSYDLTGIARSEMHVGHAADDSSKRAFLISKSNVAGIGHALAFTIDEGDMFKWLGPSDLTAADLQAPESKKEDAGLGSVEEAMEFLKDALLKGPRPPNEIIAEGKKMHISERTLWRAKKKLKVESVKNDFTGGWEWVSLEWHKK
jgi:hypothetical protein